MRLSFSPRALRNHSAPSAVKAFLALTKNASLASALGVFLATTKVGNSEVIIDGWKEPGESFNQLSKGRPQAGKARKVLLHIGPESIGPENAPDLWAVIPAF
jgi:hypothetical protein